MPRSMWSGAISFGLINVPVKMVSAVQRQTVRFNELHEPDGARIRHRRVCGAEDKEVPYDEIVKGYDLGGDKYVIVTSEELERLEPKKTRMIEIEDFVDLADIDPMLYDSSYYLVPDGEPAARAYALLRQAMEETGKVAIGRVVIRTKEHLAAIRPTGGALAMSTMLFADEVVDEEQLELPDGAGGSANEREVAMARQLVESLSAPFEPEKYHDEYRERVLELIDCKTKGEEVVSGPEVEDEPTAAPDLMAALEASIAAASKGGRSSGNSGSGSANGSGDGDVKKRSSSSSKGRSSGGGSKAKAKAKK